MTEIKPRILIIDDDRKCCNLLYDYLVGHNFDVAIVDGGELALEHLRVSVEATSLVILDVVRPEKDGLATLCQLKKISDIPVIMLSARNEPTDRSLGLELGADDYLGKPFLAAELLARIRAKLRKPLPAYRAIVEIGELRLIASARRAYVLNHELSLTAAEFALLHTLAVRQGTTLSRDELTLAALGRPITPYERCIDVHVSSLRSKLAGASPSAPEIVAVRFFGYLLRARNSEG